MAALSKMLVAGLCGLAALLGADGAGAQQPEPDSVLDALLRKHRYTLALDDGRLTGPGAEFLLGEGERAHFFMLGEAHGIADVPELASALFRALRPHGYEHLVIETSPGTAALLDRIGRGGRDSLRALIERAPLGVPFYNWHEEAQLLVDVLAGAEPHPVLWGVDYDFVLGTALALAELERGAPTEQARAVVRRYREQAEAGERAFAGGDPSRLFFLQADPGDYAALRAALGGDAEALARVRVLEESAEVWKLQFAGEGYRSNLLRTDLMKREFAEAYRRAKGDRVVGPRALLKFGANHLFRGRTPVNVLDVGTMAAMLAEYEGSHAFNLIAVAGPGTRTTYFHPTTPGTRAVETAEWAAPLYAATDPERWTVFDLRPLRPLLHAGRLKLAPELERLVWGYDAYLVLSGSRPAGYTPPPPQR